MEHAFLAPSSAGIFVHCSMAPTAQFKYPSDATDDTRAGEASHWVGSEILDSYVNVDSVKLPSEFEGKTAPNGVLIDKEMTEGAEVYINDILLVAQEAGLLQCLQVEQRVCITRVHPDKNWGTPDCWVYDIKSNTLYVWDYKFGHKYVDIFENYQVINYAIGIVDHITGGNGIADQALNVVMRIVQPRCYQSNGVVREWRIKASDLRAYANSLQRAASEATGNNATFTSGPHCLQCSARKACPGAQAAAMAAIDVSNMSGSLLELTPEYIGLELTLLKRAQDALKARVTGLEAQIESIIMGGDTVPGWETDEKLGNLKWDAPINEVLTMGNMYEHNLQKPDLITPTQAIKLGIDADVIKAYSSRTKNGFKLKKFDGSLARRVFSQRRFKK